MSSQVTKNAHYADALRAMENGDERAKTAVAFYCLSGKDSAEIDLDGAVALLEERTKDRDAEAMWMLGLCCEFGIGTERDVMRGMSLYRQSRDSGNTIGEFLLGNCLSGEESVSLDLRWGSLLP